MIIYTTEIKVLPYTLDPLIVRVHIRQPTIIFSFADYGLALGQNLDYTNDDVQQTNLGHTCKYIQQEINFNPKYKNALLHLIRNYSQQEFTNNYVNGSLQIDIPSILEMVKIDIGAAILTSEGMLYLIIFNRNAHQESHQVQIVEFKNINQSLIKSNISRIFMGYNNKNLFIITQVQALIINLNTSQSKEDNASYIGDIISTMHNHDITKIRSIRTSKYYLYIAVQGEGVYVYYFYGAILFSIQRIKCNPLDIRVVIKPDTGQLGHESLYALEFENGIKAHDIYYLKDNISSSFMQDYQDLGFIGIRGGKYFDIHENNIMQVVENDGLYQVINYKLNRETRTWIEINRWTIPGIIKQIHMNQEFAIIQGENGHHILYHSVYSEFYQHKESIKQAQELYIPSLRHIEFNINNHNSHQTGKDYDRYMFGITNHNFFYQEWKQVIIPFTYIQKTPISILCYAEDDNFVDQAPLRMNYVLNSTQCPLKMDRNDDVVMCTTTLYIEVQFIGSYITQSNILWIILMATILSAAFFIFSMFIVAEFIKYRQGKQDLQTIETQQVVSEHQINAKQDFIFLPMSPTPLSERF